MNSRSLEFWHFGVPTVTDMEATAACCEELGFDGLTLTDSQNLSPDTYVALTLAARATTAHRYQHPGAGPLRAADFSGGDATVRRKLEELGFTVEVMDAADEERASEHLVTGRIYTRADLQDQFAIRDATINTGVFRPRGFSSVWLFVTEEKTSDRTQYRDDLDGDVLHWEGQTSGRTDSMIIEHRRRGLELLLFHRRSRREHPGGGFRYEGPFEYVAHEGGGPTRFVLRRDQTSIEQAIEVEIESNGAFSPSDVTDACRKIMAAIVQRRGQRAFRETLMQAYDGRCAITGCTVREILEAAHIHPYRGDATNDVTNGLLLRSDLHTLFDCGLVAVDETRFVVLVASALDGSEYELDTLTIRIPMQLQRRGGRKLIMTPEGVATAARKPSRDETLVRALVRAHRWRRRIESGQARSITDLAEQEGVTAAYVCRFLPLTCLAPDIVEAILDGRQPKGLRLVEMLGNGPLVWESNDTIESDHRTRSPLRACTSRR